MRVARWVTVAALVFALRPSVDPGMRLGAMVAGTALFLLFAWLLA